MYYSIQDMYNILLSGFKKKIRLLCTWHVCPASYTSPHMWGLTAELGAPSLVVGLQTILK